ncbi:hypothetical protein [Acinetobacter modestus]|uniref:hypothetical protein n=1 Tax=Acinetobacter modestus TaxID=1776740 RepID=UPI001F4A2705|nr:hypothetical protein [Acinetobacter modestus]MCH7334786.1 hypothetical protein [Acinetobacter modestus]
MNFDYVQLSQSKSYKIIHLYESAYIAPLQSSDIYQYIEIGDFYGNPEVAIIDQNEKWCAVGGCGLIIYFIQEPFTPYQYDQESSQYFEIHRSPPSIWWIEDLQQISQSKILITLEDSQTRILDIFTKEISH